ncbi:hypothetical protein GLU01_00050 [Nanohaloarchaea archaeon]|nr:hypothetical protein [Candidatus Nanohaloarchaea archaeon]
MVLGDLNTPQNSIVLLRALQRTVVKIARYRKDDSDIVPDDRYEDPSNEYKEFKTEAEKAIRHCEEVFDIDTDFVVKLARTDTTGFDPQEAHPGNSFMGFSAVEGMRGSNENQVFVRATTQVDYWRPALRDMLNHEVGHQAWYQTGFDAVQSQYFNLRFEGHAMNFAGRINEERNYSWSTPERTSERPEVDAQQLLKDLEHRRHWKDSDSVDLSKQMFQVGGDRYRWAEGYTIAYQVVKQVMQTKVIGITDIPTLQQERWRKMCESAIKEMYA